MTTDPHLDAALKSFYEAQALTEAECAGILPPDHALPSVDSVVGSPLRRWVAAAAVVLLTGLGALVWILTQSPESPSAAVIAPMTTANVPEAPPNPPDPAPLVANMPGNIDPGETVLTVISVPGGASVIFDDQPQGITPLVLEDIDSSRAHTLRLVLDGFIPYQRTLRVEGDQRVIAELEPTPDPSERRSARSDSNCGLDGTSKLSIMALGAPDCRIRVGGKSLGDAPQFKRDAPVGQCEVYILCANDKYYRTTLDLKDGKASKLIIKPDMWKRAGDKASRTPRPPATNRPNPPPTIKEIGYNAEDFYAAGAAAIKRKNYTEAERLFSQCIQADRTSAKCYRALGITYAKLGNGPKAARQYGLYLKYAPNAKDAPQVRKLLEQSGRR